MPPKIAPFDFGSEPSNSGDSASVQCLVTSGDQPIEFRFYFNDRPISEIFGISTVKLGKRTYALTIDSVSGKHAGSYQCQAENLAGIDRYSAELVVNGIKLRNGVKVLMAWRRSIELNFIRDLFHFITEF